MLEMKVGMQDKTTIIIVAIVMIIILVVLLVIMSASHDYYNSLTKPGFMMPEWLFLIFLIVTIFIVGYVGIVIWKHSQKKREILFTLWVLELVLLFGSFLAFFNEQSPETAAYILMLFLAVHLSITYKLQYIDTFSASMFLITGIWMVYVILTVLEFSRLN